MVELKSQSFSSIVGGDSPRDVLSGFFRMKTSYSFKLEANPGKVAKLDLLLVEWVRLVNEKIVDIWPLTTQTKYPPNELCAGSHLIAQSARKAWSMCKSAKLLNGSRPVYRGKTIELDASQSKVNLSPTSTEFDGWVDVMTLVKFKRVALPFRFYEHFNKEYLSKPLGGIRISRRSKGWYLTLVFDVAEPPESSTKRIGIDVGYSIAAATSTGEMHGRELESLQRRTKWRWYKCDMKKPYRQGLNRVVKQIVADHPQTDFSVEQLNFKGKGKGKRKRSPIVRTRLSRFAYQHLAQRLERIGQAEGFRVFYVPSPYTSQRCAACGCVDKRNRNGERFACVACGHKDHADTNAAININGGERVVNYVGSASPESIAYQSEEYPGTMGAPTKKQSVKTR